MDEDDDVRMNGAELQIWLDLLGLTYDVAGKLLHVRADTVSKWCYGKGRIPLRVGDEMAEIDAYTSAAIGRVVDGLRNARDPGVLIYRSDADLWQEMPQLAPYSARWWRMVAARASLEGPGTEAQWSS